jgi:hypothetical protein
MDRRPKRESYHSIAYWRELLLQLRVANPFDKDFQREMIVRTTRIHEEWTVDMRYHHSVVNDHASLAIFQSVERLLANRVNLWRR